MPIRPDDNTRKRWLDLALEGMSLYSRRNALYTPFSECGHSIMHFLEINGLPEVKNARYISAYDGILTNLKNYINTAEDTVKASGAVMWGIIKKSRDNFLPDYAKTPEDYRQQRRTQRNFMTLLADLNLNLSAKDKINALDFLEYKYASDEFRAVYNQLGRYEISANPQDADYEKKQTVKLFHELHRECQKTTRKAKIISAKTFLETVARNADLLKDVEYEGLKIDEQSKADIWKVMKNAPEQFSEQCTDYFSLRVRPTENTNAFIKAILNKFNSNSNPEHKKKIISLQFADINKRLAHQDNVNSDLIDNYSKYLMTYASWNHDDRTVNAKVLEKLLAVEAAAHNERTKTQSLFPEYLTDKDMVNVNKNSVLKVARNYAASFSTSHSGAEEFNPNLHESMGKMFSKIVCSGDYRKAEVQQLCDALGQNKDEAMAKMTKSIMSAYTAKTASRPYRGR